MADPEVVCAWHHQLVSVAVPSGVFGGGRSELIFGAPYQQPGMLPLADQVRLDLFQPGRNEVQSPNAFVLQRNVEGHAGPERVTGKTQTLRVYLAVLRYEIQRCAHVHLLVLPVAMISLAAADAAEVETKGSETAFFQVLADRQDDIAGHPAAEQGVRVAYHHRREWALPCRHVPPAFQKQLAAGEEWTIVVHASPSPLPASPLTS